MESSQRRVHQLQAHLNLEKTAKHPPQLETSDTAEFSIADALPAIQQLKERVKPFVRDALPYLRVKTDVDLSFNPETMNACLDPRLVEWRRKMLNLLATHPTLKQKHTLGMPLHEQRELILKQLKVVVESRLFDYLDYSRNPLRFVESLVGLATKVSVNFGLFGGTLVSLGSKKHVDAYEDKVRNLQVRGGFGLTELGHGSNARAIETTAAYDPKTQEFILNSPTQASQKFWIGNFACHCNYGAIFAQLYVNGRHHGVHCFLVQMREDDGTVCPGIRIQDCGVKSGLNGIDNGSCMFYNKRVPRDALLDRFGSVTPAGEYVSDISSNSKRFTTMIAALVGGRVVVSQGALNISKVGLTVALRYALTRRQFGPSEGKEILLMDFLSHQRRLLPLLAKQYALQFAMNRVKELYASNDAQSNKALHVLVSAIKPAATWHKTETLQECREACGGMGFHADNRIGVLKNDSDIDVTWEGDNSVLLQQVASSLLPKGGASAFVDMMKKSVMLEVKQGPIKRGLRTSAHLRNFDFYRHAMEYREARLIRAVMNRLYRNKHLGQFEAWNNSLDLVKELALAHADRVIVEAFTNAVNEADLDVQPMLSALCSLYGLSTIQKNLDFFLTFRYITPMKGKAIWEEINSLCRCLRPHVRALVDSFGIPEGLVDAPIAGDWVGAFSYD